MYRSVQRVRYPPFEHYNTDPEKVPLVEVLLVSENEPPPEFKLGAEKGWMVEWRDEREGDENLVEIHTEVTRETLPFLMRTRNGWYIEPDPIHSLARRMIVPSVIILTASLILHALEPALIDLLGVMAEIIYTPIRIGPLDYPLLILVSFPIFILPIIIRIVANIRDIRRQESYISKPLGSPLMEIGESGSNSIQIIDFQSPRGFTAKRCRVQVGVAVPERGAILKATNTSELGQPAPGMSTALPERRVSTADEHGTGVGESLPMTVSRGRVLLLEPMRVQSSGPWNDMSSGDIILEGPDEQWPGSIYSAMIAVHWEIVVEGVTDSGTKMKWVRPIIMENSKEVSIGDLPVRSGRIEG
ncbi:MAG: hypothetical protein CMB53_02770 [Euryarchaeota archaeon]|nr:hypothetical protein [Euryarchaeota archaeon]|tara:strand:+ start:5788 stop:6861 length:1074 start_codon:yes stop_codon:yes gene_type:complete